MYGLCHIGALFDVCRSYVSISYRSLCGGASDPKAGAPGSLYSVNSDERLNHCLRSPQGFSKKNVLRFFNLSFERKDNVTKREKDRLVLPSTV